jgi:hypothetical protein
VQQVGRNLLQIIGDILDSFPAISQPTPGVFVVDYEHVLNSQ